MKLLYFSLAWILGILIGYHIALPVYYFGIGILPLAVIPFLPRYRKSLIVLSVFILVLIGGNLRMQQTLDDISKQQLQAYNDKGLVKIEGTIIETPEIRDNAVQLELAASSIEFNDNRSELSGKILVRTNRYPEYHYGDYLKLTGELETPHQFEGFDYKKYLALQDIYSIMYYPHIELIESGRGPPVLTGIYSLRNRLSQNLARALPEPQGSLAQGIFLGIRSNIPQHVVQMFSETGTAHLLAISGLHLSIIIGLLLSSSIWLLGKRYYSYVWLALICIWFYAIITGLRPPIVRGATMGTMLLIAELLGRQRSAPIALVFAAAIMVGITPTVLWDTSFQLSFLAMAGLAVVFPHVQASLRKRMTKETNFKSTLYIVIIEAVAVTTIATLTTWPLIVYHFGILSLVGIPATFFSLPVLPAIILLSGITALAGMIAPLLAQIFGWLAWLFLSYLLVIIQIFHALPLSFIKIDNIQSWQIWMYYIILIAAIISFTKRKTLRSYFILWTKRFIEFGERASKTVSKLPVKYTLAPLLLLSVLVWTAIAYLPDGKLHVSYMNVGQGDAILIQTPNNQNILIDGGPSPQAIKLELGKKLPFWERTIDLMIVTQPHADHITGLLEVVKDYNVKQIIEPEIDYRSAVYDQFSESCKQKGIERVTVYQGQRIHLGNNLNMDIIHPPIEQLQDTANDVDNNGLVLRLQWDEVSFLFTADIEKEAEWYLISQRAHLKSDVLKVAHHGSITSTSPEFLTVTNPELAIISVGKDNPYSHPHEEVMSQLSSQLGEDRIFVTSVHGTVELATDAHRLWVKTEY
jgi:competence protein ComEC